MNNQANGKRRMTPPDVAMPDTVESDAPLSAAQRPSRKEAQDAVRVLLSYIGENPAREGLQDTPKRVVKSFDEYFGGYDKDPVEILARTFEETEGYDEMVMLRDIAFVSHCEHHMVPFTGKATIAYLPRHRVVGVSKLARVVDLYANRLQIQERLTAQIAESIDKVLEPRGVAVVIRSQHQCMTTRGVCKHEASMVTTRMLGAFKTEPAMREEFNLRCGPLD